MVQQLKQLADLAENSLSASSFHMAGPNLL